MGPLTLTEQQHLREVVEAFWGPSITAHWEMNEALLQVVTKMINESKMCSLAMDFVPRPGLYLDLNDVKKELERIAKRLAKHGPPYWLCQQFGAYKWRTEAEMAAQGIP